MDDVIINKIETIKNCLRRIREEYNGSEEEFKYNYTKQDSIILNLQRACEATIDLGMRVVRLKNLGVPQASRDVFIFLEQNDCIDTSLSQHLQSMVGFRNIAVHNYQKVSLDIVQSIIEKQLVTFEAFCRAMQKMH